MGSTCDFWLSIELQDHDENEERFLKLLREAGLLTAEDDLAFDVPAAGGKGEDFYSFRGDISEGMDYIVGCCRNGIAPEQFLCLEEALRLLAEENGMEVARISMQGENFEEGTIQRYEYPLPKFLRPDSYGANEDFDEEENDGGSSRKYCLLTFDREDVEAGSGGDDQWISDNAEVLEEVLRQCAEKLTFDDELHSPVPVRYFVYDDSGEMADYDIWEPVSEDDSDVEDD